MGPNRLTERAQEALRQAQTVAARHNHQQVDNEHLLLALLEQEGGVAPRMVLKAGADISALRAGLEKALASLPQVSGSGRAPGQVYITPRLDETLAAAEAEAKRLKDEYVSVEHLLLALSDESRGGAAAKILKRVEKDAALERRFQPVMVDQPSVEDTISILRGLKDRYEIHHGVKIKDAALVAAAVLSHRYITDRFLPDKAIDLVDEAAARLRTEIDSLPSELDELTRRVMQLEIEREALKKETDPASRDRLEKLERELADLKAQADALRAQWQVEKQGIGRLRAIREQIEATKREIEQAERAYDLNRAAELRYGRLGELERRLRAEEETLTRRQGGGRLLKEEVDEEDIAKVVSRWTGIPVTRLLGGEM
jgi:ATP-dependent Clp protease ATP-binding subunit ClpA